MLQEVLERVRGAHGARCLRVLASFSYWWAGYSNGDKLSWDRAIEDVLQDGGKVTFDRAKIRGRGAWTEEV